MPQWNDGTLKQWMKFLSRANHMEIIQRLMESPADVTRLAVELGVELSSISRQLQLLREAGVIEARHFKKKHIQSLCKTLDIRLNQDSLEISLTTGNGDVLLLRTMISELQRRATERRTERHYVNRIV